MQSPDRLRPARLGTIVLIGEYRFPDGDAAAIRTMSLARAFRDLGARVIVLGKGVPRTIDFDPRSGWHTIEGIEYRTMNPSPVSVWRRLKSPLQRLRLFPDSLAALQLDDCRAVVINACDSARHVPWVWSYCRRRSIPLVADVCEWYDPRQMPGGWLNPMYLAFTLVFRIVLPRLRHFIVVSELLERRFSGRGRNVVRVASPIDTHEVDVGTPSDWKRLVFLYAGAAGRKDLLAEFIVALASLTDEERSRVQLTLLGATHADLVELLGDRAPVLEQLGATVQARGRVPRSVVLEHLRSAHFTILFRPDLRYARAGFPSKVPESLAAGTPVILNLTGDLRAYLVDGSNSLIADAPTPESIARTLRRALALTPEQLARMRTDARRAAEEHFDYRQSFAALTYLLRQLG